MESNSCLCSTDDEETTEASAITSQSLAVLPKIESGRKFNNYHGSHGSRFQSKLLYLFFMRAVNNKFKFHLGTQMFKFCGKFDDVIFIKYDKSIDGLVKRSWLYLQAKHKRNETKCSIKAADLLNSNRGSFSQTKYFLSYRDNVMKAEGGPQPLGEKMDCVIFTNIDFDKEDLTKNGVELTLISQDQLNDLLLKLLTF